MIVRHPDRLHECVTDRGADELEAAAFQLFAHPVGLGSAGGNLLHRFPAVLDWLAVDELPDELVKRTEFVSRREKRPRVDRHGGHLQSIADNARILQTRGFLPYSELRKFVRIELQKCLTIVFPQNYSA